MGCLSTWQQSPHERGGSPDSAQGGWPAELASTQEAAVRGGRRQVPCPSAPPGPSPLLRSFVGLSVTGLSPGSLSLGVPVPRFPLLCHFSASGLPLSLLSLSPCPSFVPCSACPSPSVLPHTVPSLSHTCHLSHLFPCPIFTFLSLCLCLYLFLGISLFLVSLSFLIFLCPHPTSVPVCISCSVSRFSPPSGVSASTSPLG